MFGLGFGELVLILIIALIFIGPKKLPELAKGLGQGMREFQKAAKGFTDQLQEETKVASIEEEKPEAPKPEAEVKDSQNNSKDQTHS